MLAAFQAGKAGDQGVLFGTRELNGARLWDDLLLYRVSSLLTGEAR